MEITAAVLHDNALAHYDVSINNDGICTAHLSNYKGSKDHFPPDHIELRKEGRHWIGNVTNKDLVTDLGYAVEMKVPLNEVIINARKRNSSHPAG